MIGRPNDELRATADRRKISNDPAANQLRNEGLKQMASRLVKMFPLLPEETVEAILSELFRADAKITRETLTDRAISKLVEMSLEDRTPQVITSFEPPAIGDPFQLDAMDVDEVPEVGPNAVPLLAADEQALQ